MTKNVKGTHRVKRVADDSEDIPKNRLDELKHLARPF